MCAAVIEALPEGDGDVDPPGGGGRLAARAAERGDREAREAVVELRDEAPRGGRGRRTAATEALAATDDPRALADAAAALGRAEDALAAARLAERDARNGAG